MDNVIAEKLLALSKSSFRASFQLTGKELVLAANASKVQQDCCQIIWSRLAPAQPHKDGKQTPYRGHPVFVAQHATGTCCRSCLSKWHQIPRGHLLTPQEMFYVCKLIRTWILHQVKLHQLQKSPLSLPQAAQPQRPFGEH